MRKFFIVSAFVTVGVVASSSAVANYMYPGRVIIGYGSGGGGSGGSTTNAAALGDPEKCVLPHEIECECFEGLTLIEACEKLEISLECLGPESEYAELVQKSLVLSEGESKTLGSLECSGKSDETAYVKLPLPEG